MPVNCRRLVAWQPCQVQWLQGPITTGILFLQRLPTPQGFRRCTKHNAVSADTCRADLFDGNRVRSISIHQIQVPAASVTSLPSDVADVHHRPRCLPHHSFSGLRKPEAAASPSRYRRRPERPTMEGPSRPMGHRGRGQRQRQHHRSQQWQRQRRSRQQQQQWTSQQAAQRRISRK